ncbi:L,D-transpeptidase family protein [Microbacterium sp. NPDC055903]
MTDLVAASGSDTAATEVVSEAVSSGASGTGENPPLEWAPIEPAPKKRRVGMWVGIAAGVAVLGAAAASLVLIAPGTSVAGIQVGWQTPGMASETIASRLADTEITLTGAGGDAVLTGADLGASIDAEALAEQAFADRPMWNLAMWGADPIDATITIDQDAALSALRSAVPSSFTDATDATVVFDAATSAYVTTPAASGTGIDVDTLTAAFIEAVGDGKSELDFSGDPTEAQPAISDDEAAATAAELNGMLGTIGFYVGEERTVPVAPAVAATWLTVTPKDGELVIDADEAAIQAVVDTVPKAVNRAAVNATTVVNSSGEVLRELAAGASGREVGDLSSAANDFASQLSDGNAAFALPVEEVPFQTTDVVRKVEVNLSEQRLYLLENGKVIDSWLISSGKRGNDTETGTYTINWKLESQNMGREDTSVRPFYYQPNVRWVMYFNGDQALHGVYWHSNWGNRMSHGCVGMPNSRAQQIYEWAPQGVEVWIHN